MHRFGGTPFSRHPEMHGKLVLVLSALFFSLAGFFTRMAPVDLGAAVFWRNLFGSLVLLPLIAATEGAQPWRSLLRFGLSGWAMVAASALATICYLAAFASTSVADVSIIYATTPLIAALLAWVAVGERASRTTLVGAVLAFIGVGITMGGSLRGGRLRGDLLALAMAASYAAMTVLARLGPPRPPLVAAWVASVLAALVVLPLGWSAGARFDIPLPATAWLAGFGICCIAVALPLYLAGARRVAAGQAALISALELPLAPLWVWLAFGEVPARASMIGGAVVVLATALQFIRST